MAFWTVTWCGSSLWSVLVTDLFPDHQFKHSTPRPVMLLHVWRQKLDVIPRRSTGSLWRSWLCSPVSRRNWTFQLRMFSTCIPILFITKGPIIVIEDTTRLYESQCFVLQKFSLGDAVVSGQRLTVSPSSSNAAIL